LRPKVVGFIGLAIVFFQQLFALVPRMFSPGEGGNGFTRFWEFIYSSGFESYPGMNVLYVIVPWIGVMMAGYGFGTILLMEEKRRKTICLYVGVIGFVLYLVAGSIIAAVADPNTEIPFLFKLLNQRKYPASQLFLLMTISPMILLVPYVEKAKGWFADALAVIGRVPFFYYLAHILTIHVSALIVNLIRTGEMHHDWYMTAPYAFLPEETRWSLPMLYMTFAVDVIILFLLCRWYAGYKASHPDKAWLKYL